jgi:hypothetical protein
MSTGADGTLRDATGGWEGDVATPNPYRQTVEMPTLLSLLEKHGACRDARTWATGRTVSEDSWFACDRGDWLIWIAARLGVDRRLVVLAACDCARLALPRIPDGEHRPRLAIEAAERWARGEATIEEVRAAASAADAYATYATYAACAAYAASAASAVASAASASAASAVASAATAASYAAYAAYAADDAYAAVPRTCADLVRARIPWAVVAERIEVSHG